MRIHLSLLLLLLVSYTHCEAKVTGLFSWTSKNQELRLILPEIEGETLEQTTEKFQRLLLSSHHPLKFRNYFHHSPGTFEPFKGGGFVRYKVFGKENSVSLEKASLPIAIIANRPSMLSIPYSSGETLYRYFSRAGAQNFIVPYGIQILFSSDEEQTEYETLVSQHFSALISPGGSDIDPKFYHQPVTYSRNMNSYHDEFELRLIKKFIETDLGVFYGICRGHQAYAVALGGELYQDLSLQKVNRRAHEAKRDPQGNFVDSWHTIVLSDDSNGLFEAIRKLSFSVNSRHHQAVKSIPRGRVIALEDKKVIEAIETKDLNGNTQALTVQFHPEDMDTEDARNLAVWMIKNAEKRSKIKN